MRRSNLSNFYDDDTLFSLSRAVLYGISESCARHGTYTIQFLNVFNGLSNWVNSSDGGLHVASSVIHVCVRAFGLVSIYFFLFFSIRAVIICTIIIIADVFYLEFPVSESNFAHKHESCELSGHLSSQVFVFSSLHSKQHTFHTAQKKRDKWDSKHLVRAFFCAIIISMLPLFLYLQ